MTNNPIEHTALYRKYRPETFDQVIGQDHVKEVLQGAIASGKISHAYLFSGTRGTGKTTMARIFARAVGASPNDIYEIDAASNRGIDDIRQLRDAVATLPFESPYKVYIIDEVHMLTKDAFNALLKTLEEPPRHVIFIFATTELHKVLETILSRCQVFTFHKPSSSTLREMLTHIALQEEKNLEPSAAATIAILGEGSFRDAQSVLQKVLSISGNEKNITAEQVERVTGAPSGVLVNEIIKNLAEKNREGALTTLEKIVDQNIDIEILIRLLMHKIRSILLLRFSKNAFEKIQIEFSEDDVSFLQRLVGIEGKEINAQLLARLLDVFDQTKHSYIKQLPLELAFMQILGQDSTA
jgi:DNA polymerase-3 subunit gamma/tau